MILIGAGFEGGFRLFNKILIQTIIFVIIKFSGKDQMSKNINFSGNPTLKHKDKNMLPPPPSD